MLRATLMAIDEVLRPHSKSDSPHQKEPASVKKMKKGDAHWATRSKRILGWDRDTESNTLHLPSSHRLERLQHFLTWLLPPHKRLPVTSGTKC